MPVDARRESYRMIPIASSVTMKIRVKSINRRNLEAGTCQLTYENKAV